MSIYESGQMYLETIYILSQKKSHVRAIDVGEQMGYSKPSVSRALSILKRDDYVSVDDTGGISLTAKGMEVAKTMYTRHTVLSQLLMRLGVDEKTATEDACKIEHVILLAKNLLRQYKNTGCKFLITLGQNFIHVISSITQKQFFLFGMSHRTIFFSLY